MNGAAPFTGVAPFFCVRPKSRITHTKVCVLAVLHEVRPYIRQQSTDCEKPSFKGFGCTYKAFVSPFKAYGWRYKGFCGYLVSRA